MRHAREQALDQLEPLLLQLRDLGRLRERKRGAFYLKNVGFLHFHEDPAGLFADVKVGKAFERLPANTPDEQGAILDLVGRELSGLP